jgi:hypothetical protein
LSNENGVINHVLWRYIKPPPGLAGDVDCERCTRSLNDLKFASRWSDFKCCAFQPFIANFLCGAMLEAGIDPIANDATKIRPEAIGILPTLKFREKISTTRDHERGEAHTCAYYDLKQRRCGIWSHRPGECSLYFCSSDARKVDRTVWSERVFEVEAGIAQMALAHLGFGPQDISREVDRLNGGPQGFLDRAEALEVYRECWQWAKTQTETDVRGWLAFDKSEGEL